MQALGYNIYILGYIGCITLGYKKKQFQLKFRFKKFQSVRKWGWADLSVCRLFLASAIQAPNKSRDLCAPIADVIGENKSESFSEG